jgi:hemerythrin-like metal-binding protein
MAFIEWEYKYSTLHDKLDDEHRVLFDAINDLYKAMSVGQGHLLVCDILKKLYEYTCTHFRDEEEFMREAEYDGLDAQIEQHRIFTDKLFEFMKDARDGKRILHIDVALFLKEWITNHILKVDSKLRTIISVKFNATLK